MQPTTARVLNELNYRMDVLQLEDSRLCILQYKIANNGIENTTMTTTFISKLKCNHMHSKGNYGYTQASEASSIVPIVQKVEKITIQVPLFGAGTNSRNQVVYTGPPPKPMPTMKRRMTNDI